MLSPYETSQVVAQHLSGICPAHSGTPLIGERMRVTIRGGLALVNREQRFRNSADTSIETTITFPVPIHATLCHLSADIGGRTLLARAEPRTVARETYEQGIDEGRLSILHEELVRGVHMLSIGHIPPGAEITVTHRWIMPLQSQGGTRALLRIPTTLGDVYGCSPLGDADDLITSPQVTHEAEIEVDAGGADVRVRGLAEGQTRLRLDAPVDIEVTGDVWGVSRGSAADGRIATVSVAPDAIEGADIDAAVLVDRSGSMGSAASLLGPGGRLSKHEAVKAGLAEAARALHPGDRIELWQFDHTCERVSKAEVSLAKAIERLGQPQGGTEIGTAIEYALAGSAAREIIVVTDGLSHALDVQALANSGRRFTVVLVGDDALEANVGRLTNTPCSMMAGA
ncbi:VIT domain-containing protein [Camelimonas lactis]|uniref:von Willebrand factor type A domain-containing protein n=1 Tax=Camelimonas lactis TaxID=659006 RepID=A0A4R2GPT5_9HYPH|nr:VIT domain-containing protein [Camelimonas lactis]TCO11166.1 von Willebrand factor type A domain-containing protein [Camelimonas lactis]